MNAFLDRYGARWTFEVDGEALTEDPHLSRLFAIPPAKVLSFAKDPHAQTGYAVG